MREFEEVAFIQDIFIDAGPATDVEGVVIGTRIDVERSVFVEYNVLLKIKYNRIQSHLPLSGLGQLVDLFQAHPVVGIVGSESVNILRPGLIEICVWWKPVVENYPTVDRHHWNLVRISWNGDVEYFPSFHST